MSTDQKTRVLDSEKQPIKFDQGTKVESLSIGRDGAIQSGNETLGKIGLFNVPDEKLLRPVGGSLLKVPASVQVDSYAGEMESGALEGSNVDPALELTKLMEAQRMLDANAHLIQTQDQGLGRLVNDVGRISC